MNHFHVCVRESELVSFGLDHFCEWDMRINVITCHIMNLHKLFPCINAIESNACEYIENYTLFAWQMKVNREPKRWQYTINTHYTHTKHVERYLYYDWL